MITLISNTPPPEALEAINSGVTQVIRRCDIYESDGETLWVPPNGETRSRLIGGGISLDYSRAERRTFDIQLDNSDGMLDTNSSEGFWYNKILKPYRGVRYPITPVAPHYHTSAEWLIQMGEFMIDKIDDQTKESTIKVSGRDYTKKCINSKLERSMTFPAGTFIYELIRSLASNAGIRKMKIPFTNETLQTDLDLERGTERWNVMLKAANSHSYDIYFDNEGYLTMTKYADPAINPPIATFKTGVEGNLVTFSRSTNDSRLYNHIIVTGDRESVEGGAILMPYFGEARNDDPASATNIDEIGDRAYFYASSFFTSDQQCVELAHAWLKIYSLESYEINWTAVNYPWLDVGKVIEMYEDDSGSRSTKFLVDTLNHSLDLEPMSATGKRVLAIG